MSESDEPQKPRRFRAITVHDMRQLVSARHKMLASNKPYDEAKKLIQDTYKADDDSCLAFIQWLKGEDVPGQPAKNNSIDRLHVVTDPQTGDDSYLDTEPGSVPPRPRPKGRGK